MGSLKVLKKKSLDLVVTYDGRRLSDGNVRNIGGWFENFVDKSQQSLYNTCRVADNFGETQRQGRRRDNNINTTLATTR